MSDHQNYNLSKITSFTDRFVTICPRANNKKMFATTFSVNFSGKKQEKRFLWYFRLSKGKKPMCKVFCESLQNTEIHTIGSVSPLHRELILSNSNGYRSYSFSSLVW